MKLREEIEFTLVNPALGSRELKTNQIINLFRSWALGCVGEEEEDIHHDPLCHPYTLDGREYECSCGNAVLTKGRNQAKQEIRKKIREETK